MHRATYNLKFRPGFPSLRLQGEKPRKTPCWSFFPCICAVNEAIDETAGYSADLLSELARYGSNADVKQRRHRSGIISRPKWQ